MKIITGQVSSTYTSYALSYKIKKLQNLHKEHQILYYLHSYYNYQNQLKHLVTINVKVAR